MYNPFPVGYQPYNPYQFQTPAQPQQQQTQTKYVEVIPVDSVEEASACPMAAGSSFLFFARDDSFIAVKSAGVNGQNTFHVYDKRPPAPTEPVFRAEEYVRKDELPGLLEAVVAAHKEDKE